MAHGHLLIKGVNMKKIIPISIFLILLSSITFAWMSSIIVGGGGTAPAGSTFTLVDTATAGGLSVNTITCNKPTGTVENDIMIAIISHHYNDTSDGPSGWTLEADSPYINGYNNELWYLVAGASEPADYTWDGWDTSTRTRAVIATYRGGFDTADPIDASSNTVYTTYNTTLRAVTVTASVADSPLLAIGATYSTGAPMTATAPASPGTFAEDLDSYDSDGDYVSVFYSQTWAGSGATGGMDITLSASKGVEKHAFGLVLNPE